LRVLALVHDAFKRAVDATAGWSRDNDRAVLARRFAERFTSDERLLVALALHDAPYWLWRTRADDATFDGTLERIPDVALFVRVALDASTEGEDVSFLWWVRRELARRDALPEAAVDAPLPLADAGVQGFREDLRHGLRRAGRPRWRPPRLVATQARHLVPTATSRQRRRCPGGARVPLARRHDGAPAAGWRGRAAGPG
jgi:hypothetical protein